MPRLGVCDKHEFQNNKAILKNLGRSVFQRFFIMLRNAIEDKMYTKSKNLILDRIEKLYSEFKNRKEFLNEPELENISFSKESWFNFIDINLIKCDKELVLRILKEMLSHVVEVLTEVKGNNLCFKYFYEENIYAYIFNNLKLLKDLNLDTFFLELFLLL